MNERLIGLIDTKKLSKFNILLVGVGGVGSACFEVLIRSGIKNITIVDFDTYEESNLNRQLHSNLNVIGKKKIDVLKNFANTLPLDIKVNSVDVFLDSSSNLNFNKYDYIIDACDTIEAKVYLVKKALELNKKIISSMGVGNRINPHDLGVFKLSKTSNDPLAKKFKLALKKEGITKDVIVVASKELPIKKTPVSSYIGVSLVSGVLLADYVIKDLLNEN